MEATLKKANWSESRQRYADWWDRKGVILGHWGTGIIGAALGTGPQPVADDIETHHTDPAYRAARTEWDLARRFFPGDTLPLACPGFQTVELASYLGADMVFDDDTIWYKPSADFTYGSDLGLDPFNRWYVSMVDTLRRQAALCEEKYLPALPAISPNLDVLAELRGTQNFLMDLVERPNDVRIALDQIDDLFFDIHELYYEIIRQADGGSAFYYFMIWAPGRVTQLQCDVAAMISPDMFREFAVPGFRRVCESIDFTLFHVDGPPMLQHVDALLEIESLDAIEFTPGPGVPSGADPHWFDLYQRVLDAGKCVQVVVSDMKNIEPMLQRLGADGIYLLTTLQNAEQFADAQRIVDMFV